MLRIFITCVSLLLSFSAWAQNAYININILNGSVPNYRYYEQNSPLKIEMINGVFKFDEPTQSYTTTLAFNLASPRTINLTYVGVKSLKGNSRRHRFFLSPGDSISLKVDMKKAETDIEINGKGAANNYSLDFKNIETQKNYGDSLPDKVIAIFNKMYRDNKRILADYIKTHEPDNQFIQAHNLDLQYSTVLNFYYFKENNKYRLGDKYERFQPAWERAQDSLFKTVSYRLIDPEKTGGKLNALKQPLSTISNDEALISDNYQELIKHFMRREIESLANEAQTNPEQFFRQWYNADINTGREAYSNGGTNLLKEKIVNTYFTGKTADFMYACLITDALYEIDPKSIVSIFDRYKKLFPKSNYANSFQTQVDEIANREAKKLNEKMIFAFANGTTMKTLDEVLWLTKGKTILVYMWGTWNAPSRSELEKHSAAIRAHFKDKDLTYLYIANYDLKNEAGWKKQIAYFQLEGLHILADDDLNKDIMTKVKGKEYPTYFIIKKDGSYELAKAGYPMKREVLIEQLETAMAN
ncbi:TlpA family protein disulfide reductase [Mucilaginibacter antarcticus]|uniref:TlpA family protein disulfide reductase n=1 Tax=Mucilaginibacter antarcticus TaxID=1855725 RepID=A0ABW5XNB6_9SPHI